MGWIKDYQKELRDMEINSILNIENANHYLDTIWHMVLYSTQPEKYKAEYDTAVMAYKQLGLRVLRRKDGYHKIDKKQ